MIFLDIGEIVLDQVAPSVHVLKLGDPREFTIREFAEKVVEMTGSRSKLIEKPLPAGDPLQRQPDIGLAREKLDWSPTVELKAGLAKTIAYFDALLRDDAPALISMSRP